MRNPPNRMSYVRQNHHQNDAGRLMGEEEEEEEWMCMNYDLLRLDRQHSAEQVTHIHHISWQSCRHVYHRIFYRINI